jgi:DNA-binding MltR family transcriptional regulator
MVKHKLFIEKNADFKIRQKELVSTLLLESERGSVLAATALIEEDLEILLRKSFTVEKPKIKKIVDPLFSGFGPLSTFSAKIKLSYVIGLIDKQLYEDIEIFRDIRNHFAHTYRAATFEDQTVKDKLKKIGAHVLCNLKTPFQYWEFKCPVTKRKKKIPVVQYRFIMYATMIDLMIQDLFGKENVTADFYWTVHNTSATVHKSSTV